MKRRIIFVAIAMTLLLLNATEVANAGNATVIISPANITVFPGQNFTFDIIINPNGNDMAGAQSDIFYDPSGMIINNISEGNLFDKGGIYRTFFNKGTINNSNGKVINIFDAIIGRRNTSVMATFIRVNATAQISAGKYDISFDNVKISSPEGEPVNFILSNASLNILSPPTPTPTPSPTPTPTPSISCAIDIDGDTTLEYPDQNHDNLIDQTDLDYVQYAIDSGMTCELNCAIDIDGDTTLEYPDQNHDNLIDQTDLDYVQYAIDSGMTC